VSNIITGGLLTRFFGSAISNAAGYSVGGAIQPVLEPLTQDLANEAWSLHRVHPLSLAAAAQASLRGFWTDARGETEAAFTGYDGERYAIERRLQGNAPPMETLIQLRRRELISDGELTEGLQQSALLPEWRGLVAQLRNVLPSVTDLVHMAVREVFDPGQRAALDLDAEFPQAFAEHAEKIGLAPEWARNYWADHWQLPSFIQLAQMLFRGELTSAQFSDALRALDYAPTWRGKLEAIARPIPPLSDMIRFAVRDVYTPATVQAFGLDDDFPAVFAQQAALHGMDATYATQYWAAHWRLPSALQGYRMLWRGIISKAQLQTLLKALDYPPFWRERLEQLAHIVPGRIDLKRMLRHEILTPDQVEAGYRRLGYDATDAQRMREIAEAELESGVVTQRWADRARSGLYTAAHSDYLDGNASAADAQAMLARLGATSAEVNTIIAIWDVERNRTRRDLTQAQILKLAKKDVWTDAQALDALADLGMAAGDAQALIDAL